MSGIIYHPVLQEILVAHPGTPEKTYLILYVVKGFHGIGLGFSFVVFCFFCGLNCVRL